MQASQRTGRTRVQLSMMISPEIKAALQAEAERQERTTSSVAERALRAYVESLPTATNGDTHVLP